MNTPEGATERECRELRSFKTERYGAMFLENAVQSRVMEVYRCERCGDFHLRKKEQKDE